MNMKNAEIEELQMKSSYLTNYKSSDPEAPIDPCTYVDSNGDALLHIAAQRGDVRTIDLLLAAGVDLNLLGDMGNTTLHYAKSEEVGRLLLDRGASAEIRNEFARQPAFK